MRETATVTVERDFPASAERVFDAWFDVDKARRFLFATQAGEMVRVEIDARVGGRFVCVDRRGGEDVEHVGEYLEIGRPRRLVFLFSVPKYDSDGTRVSIDIEPAGAGCKLTLRHAGVWPDYRERTAAGWRMILDGLAKILGEG